MPSSRRTSSPDLSRHSIARSVPLSAVVVLLIVGIGVSLGAGWFFFGRSAVDSSNTGATSSSSQPSPIVPEVLASTDINREFFLGGLTVTITQAEKLSQLTVGGEPYPTADDEAYLSLGLELKNDGIDSITPRVINYIRLIDDQGRLFAPGFFNSEVIVPGEATVFDRVAFVIPKDQQELTLRVGEVGSEEYENISVDFEL